MAATVSSIMTVSPVVANLFHNFSQVVRLFTEFPIHHLPIVDANNKVIGIISGNDVPKVFIRLSQRDPKIVFDLDVIDKEVNLGDIMTPNPVTITTNTTIKEAATIMAERKFMALPVVDGGQIIGIVSIKDIVKHFAENMG